MIDAIGDDIRFWEGGMETALTIVPNFLWTGILGVIFGIMVSSLSGIGLYFKILTCVCKRFLVRTKPSVAFDGTLIAPLGPGKTRTSTQD